MLAFVDGEAEEEGGQQATHNTGNKAPRPQTLRP
jgi:hypothetical protein